MKLIAFQADGGGSRRSSSDSSTLFSQFLEALDINATDVDQDVEGIEHQISRSTLEAIDALTLAEAFKRGRTG